MVAITDRETMRAVVWTAYGPPEVLQVQEVPVPVPGDHQVRVRVHAFNLFAGDAELRRFALPGLFWLPLRLYVGVVRPKRLTVLGQEMAGEVEAVGKEVTRYRVGDQVFASNGFRLGTNAEYVCLPEDAMMARKPSNMSFEEATTVPVGGYNALHFVRLARIAEGERVLVNGAGGSIGTIMIQLAKLQGAHVTATDTARKLEMLTSLGADRVIDHTEEDFTRTGDTYDVIFDVVGKSPFWRSLEVLNRKGRYVMCNNGLVPPKLKGLWVAMSSRKRVIGKLAGERREDLMHLRELIEQDRLQAFIDRTYPMEDIVEAHRYVDQGLKRGNVVITVGKGDGG